MARTKHSRQTWRVAMMATTVLALGGGCTEGGATFIVVQNQVPGDGCVIPTQVGGDFRARGRIDVQASDGYLFTPVVQSFAVESTDGRNPRIFTVEGADIDLSFLPGFFSSEEQNALEDDGLTRFSQAFSGSIFPGGTASFAFLIVPRELLERMEANLAPGEITQVNAEIQIFGELDGGDADGKPFRYPVDVCNGCMTVDLGSCSTVGSDYNASEGGECNLLQDVPLECCDGICPAVGTGG